MLLLIFILENLRAVTVTYFGASGPLPLGVALLFAAIGGALFAAMVGIARLTQLRAYGFLVCDLTRGRSGRRPT